MPNTISQGLIQAGRRLSVDANKLRFGSAAAYVYNPLEYAWQAHKVYIERFGQSAKKVVFLGMNPGPWGMAQTGIPFGEINSVTHWLRIRAAVGKPIREHAKRPVDGFGCARSEVSGKRLWGLFAQRFHTAERFFARHFVANYCPLLFLEGSGKNVTPDKLPTAARADLALICGAHLKKIVQYLQTEWVIGVGAFAAKRASDTLEGTGIKVGQILHPSPASPAANKDWAGKAARQLIELGVWK